MTAKPANVTFHIGLFFGIKFRERGFANLIGQINKLDKTINFTPPIINRAEKFQKFFFIGLMNIISIDRIITPTRKDPSI
jgi:hypothetical protein